MLLEGQVGPPGSAAGDGVSKAFRLTKTLGQVVGDAHGRYHEGASRGNVFMACNQSSTTFTLFGTTTATGFLLANPSNSGVNLSVLNVGYAKVTAATTAIEQLVISGAYSAQTLSSLTALSTRCALVGSNKTGSGIAYSAATLSAAGVIIMALQSPSVSVSATTAIPPVTLWDVAGMIVVAPGAWIQLAAGFTNTLAGIAHMVWEEVPA